MERKGEREKEREREREREREILIGRQVPNAAQLNAAACIHQPMLVGRGQMILYDLFP